MAEVVEWLRSQIIADKEAAEAAGGEEWIIGTDGQQLFLVPAKAEPQPWNAERITEWTYPVNPRQSGEWEECDRSKPFHIARQDPRDTIARCEADLAILDEHEVHDSGFSRSCTVCFEEGKDGDDVPVEAPCRTVRLLAYGRRYRPGWNPDWAPEGITS